MRIAFFDSGLGGLTVLSEAIDRLPNEDLLYFADTLHIPYGTKSEEEVKRYIHHSMKQIIEEEVKTVVIACNTATSLAVNELRSMYSIPIIGMEPAVKPAVEMNRSTGKRVLVFATSLTLKQAKYADLISRVDDSHIVDSLPLPELVEYCEALNFDPKTIRDYFLKKLEGFDLNQYGTVVLGCTHYPFYKTHLQELLPGHIQIVDGSAGTVNRLVQVLRERGLENGSGNGSVMFQCSSGSQDYIEKMRQALQIYREMSQ